jgi:glucose-1-phosphate adenylyltransferase
LCYFWLSVSGCVLASNVEVQGQTVINDSILMENVIVGKHSKINKAIIDKNVIIPPYTKIGICKEDDVKRGFFVSNGGVTIVAKESILEESLPFEDKDDGEKV